MPLGLSKILSVRSKDKESSVDESGSKAIQPKTHQPDKRVSDHDSDSASLEKEKVNPKVHGKDATPGPPSFDDLSNHLRVLECFYRHKQRICSTDSLFGIHNAAVTDAFGQHLTEEATSSLLIKLAEKRWAVYVAQAADRFEQWIEAVAPSGSMPTMAQFECDGRAGLITNKGYSQRAEMPLQSANLPPVDVLMVWHAYMLNPRCYLEDCIRYGRMQLWHGTFPWEAIVSRIDPMTFLYSAEKSDFCDLTTLPWDAMDSPNSKTILCSACQYSIEAPWTTCGTNIPNKSLDPAGTIDHMLIDGNGYCDQGFSISCPNCRRFVTHDSLCAAKLRSDVERLMDGRTPMPGTMLNLKGIPFRVDRHSDEVLHTKDFNNVNRLFLVNLGRRIMSDANAQSMEDIGDMITAAFEDKEYMRKVRQAYSFQLPQSERILFNRMTNSYSFCNPKASSDLVGAVVRQSLFTEQMHCIGWLRNSDISAKMSESTKKYERFLAMTKECEYHVVPTLDIDLVWHTHQCNPHAYLQFSLAKADQFLDHPDHIPETKLNEGFAQTCKEYQRAYGEVYSTCDCWYCSTIMELNATSKSRFMGKSSRSVSATGIEDIPGRNVHISAHNCVRTARHEADYQAKANELEVAYEKACERARKKNLRVPSRDDTYESNAWGYRFRVSACSPYVGPLPYTPAYYPAPSTCLCVSEDPAKKPKTGAFEATWLAGGGIITA